MGRVANATLGKVSLRVRVILYEDDLAALEKMAAEKERTWQRMVQVIVEREIHRQRDLWFLTAKTGHGDERDVSLSGGSEGEIRTL